MLIGALHATLEHAVEALDAIGGDIAANVFLATVVDRLMVSKVQADVAVVARLIGMKGALAMDVRANDGMMSAMLVLSIWKLRLSPELRSTRLSTTFLCAQPPFCFGTSRLRPMKVSSASTTSPAPP